MKPFNLEKALAGEPVRLRNGLKAYVKYNIFEYSDLKHNTSYPLKGFYIDADNEPVTIAWTIDGVNIPDRTSEYDIVAMWEEPRPTVALTLPCPLKEPQDDMWFINRVCEEVEKSNGDSTMNIQSFNRFIYFALEEDAQAWLDAMFNSRR